MYFVQTQPDSSSAEHGSSAAKQRNRKFRLGCQKDSHVSPFNDREGSYSVSAVDIATTGIVDVTILPRSPSGASPNGYGRTKSIAGTWSTPLANSPTRGTASEAEGNESVTTWKASTLVTFQWLRCLLQYIRIGVLTRPTYSARGKTFSGQRKGKPSAT